MEIVTWFSFDFCSDEMKFQNEHDFVSRIVFVLILFEKLKI